MGIVNVIEMAKCVCVISWIVTLRGHLNAVIIVAALVYLVENGQIYCPIGVEFEKVDGPFAQGSFVLSGGIEYVLGFYVNPITAEGNNGEETDDTRTLALSRIWDTYRR
jgi:hypothetical protein